MDRFLTDLSMPLSSMSKGLSIEPFFIKIFQSIAEILKVEVLGGVTKWSYTELCGVTLEGLSQSWNPMDVLNWYMYIHDSIPKNHGISRNTWVDNGLVSHETFPFVCVWWKESMHLFNGYRYFNFYFNQWIYIHWAFSDSILNHLIQFVMYFKNIFFYQ